MNAFILHPYLINVTASCFLPVLVELARSRKKQVIRKLTKCHRVDTKVRVKVFNMNGERVFMQVVFFKIFKKQWA